MYYQSEQEACEIVSKAFLNSWTISILMSGDLNFSKVSFDCLWANGGFEDQLLNIQWDLSVVSNFIVGS